jgi:CO/xanthine dehydrogenase FAD-binding subunit
LKPGSFDYVAVTNVDEALAALASAEDARILAGGQSLIPLMNFRLARPALLVDVNGVSELDRVHRSDGEIRLGALCRHRMVERDTTVREAAPLLARAAALIGHPQIRNRGTLGGTVAHGDPAAELPAALLALGARCVVRGTDGEREVDIAHLFEGFFTTSLAPDEMVVEVIVPAAAGAGASFVEYAPRAGDFALVGAGIQLTRDADGRCVTARGGPVARARCPTT